MHAQTLRQYDRLGLVSPGRTPGGGRRYSPRDVALLREVQRLSPGGRRQPRRHQADHRPRVAGRGAAGAGARAARGARAGRDPPDRRRGRRPAASTLPAATSCRSGRPSSALVVWRPGGPTGEPDRRRRRDRTRPSCELEREIGLLLRRSRAISARLAGELHPDLDGAAYGLLALLQDAGPLRASDLVARLGPGQEHGQPAGGHPGRPRARRPRGRPGRRPGAGADAVGRRASARLARIRDVRRARWEDDLADWPAERRRHARPSCSRRLNRHRRGARGRGRGGTARPLTRGSDPGAVRRDTPVRRRL